MSKPVKLAIIFMVTSSLFSFVESYYFVTEREGFGIGLYITWGFDFLWLLLISWLAWRISKGKNWRFIVLFIGLLSLNDGLISLYESGFMFIQLTDFLEAIFLFLAWRLLRGQLPSLWVLPETKE